MVMVSLGTTKAQYDRARFYTIDGAEYPSVTTILDVLSKEGLVWWAAALERKAMETALLDVLVQDGARDPSWVLDQMAGRLTRAKAFVKEKARAAEIGTAAHAWIEWRTRQMLGEKVSEEPVIPDAAMVAVEAWKDWAVEVDFTPTCAERTIYCRACGYAGTLDWIATVRGVVTLGDYKTAKAVYPEAYLQNTAYRHAAAQLGLWTDAGLVLRLPKSLDDVKADQPIVEPAPVPDTSMEDFLAVKRAWAWRRRMEGKKTGVHVPAGRIHAPASEGVSPEAPR